MESLNYGMRLYRATRVQAKQLLTEVQHQGYTAIYIVGEGDLADIARLTCLELGLLVAPYPSPALPTLHAQPPALKLSGPSES